MICDSKRNISKNILSPTATKTLIRKYALLGMVVLMTAGSYGLTSCVSGKNASQRKIEKDRARKDKQSKKNYDKLVKQHAKNQSAATRKLMKQAKKEQSKNTPMNPIKGKKCK